MLACEGAKKGTYRIDYEKDLIYIKDKNGNEVPYQLDARFVVRSGSPTAQDFIFQMARQAEGTKQLIGITIGAGVVGGTGVGLGLAAAGGGAGITTLGLSGAGASGGVITGLYGTTTAATLESLASSGGPTVEVVTNLTQAPIAGRALSTAIGEGAEALANQAGAIRGAGQLFRARIPAALLRELERVGLAERRATAMGGGSGIEVRFFPQITQFIVKFFK